MTGSGSGAWSGAAHAPMPWRNVALDTADPRGLAEFYRSLLGWEYTPGAEDPETARDDWLTLEPPAPGGPRLAFQRSDAPVRPWPGGARVHADFTVPDLAAAHDHALACGATPLTGTPEEEGHPDDPFRVYADPAGHPFCLCAPGA
ncbi:VOC family protein [Cellulosimicrobium marinum]|uniref:VOC family protein n=1 Tax=Cellulosimicrobium marinum TaxID=1638992 RepID=UPI001E4B86B4|nr:VOC family protein [Cellulosimicrobium marinum]MCB7135557.1 VOC family protein [Cellulosimicrobium marinum]